MSPNPQLLPPGSSTYDSDTVGLHVGDGTWDAENDDFLLPNLVGLPFDAMRYNGMGNRFADLQEYHQIVLVHGIFAVITFLFVVPAAIFIARFYHRNPRLALRLHVWLQILTVFLATVVLILGTFAVGPGRALSNPHHGIGVAIYTLIMTQVLFGWFIHKREKGKLRDYIPLKLFLHQWLGRAIALLAIAQVALGLTLYGSPKSLFILYALWVFFLVILYFVLEYRNQKRFAIDDRGSYMYSATDVTGPSGRRPSEGHSKLGAVAAAGGLGALLGLLGRKRSERRAESPGRTHRTSHTDASSHRSSRRHSGSYINDEKYNDDGRPGKSHTWRDRLLAAGAAVGAGALLKKFIGGRDQHNNDDDSYSYYTGTSYDRRPLPGGRSDAETVTDIRRVEEGRPPLSPENQRSNDPSVLPVAVASPSRRSRVRSRRSGGSTTSYGSDYSYDSRSRRHSRQGSHHEVRNTIATLGVAGFLKHKWNQRKRAKEDRRVEQMRERDREQERISRVNSSNRRFTGDGNPNRLRRHHSMTGTDFSRTDASPVAGSTPALSRHNLVRPEEGSHNVLPTGASNMDLPPPPVMPAAGGGRLDSSGSEYMSETQTRHDTHRLGEAAAAGAGAAAAGAAFHSRRNSANQRRESYDNAGVGSPPVSVKVKMHNDGRHVTLRRLDPAEAAAERERREQSRRGGRSNSVSSVGGGPSSDRWRRVEARERVEAAEMQRRQQQQQQQQQQRRYADESAHNIPPIPSSSTMDLPPPPPAMSPYTRPSYAATPPRSTPNVANSHNISAYHPSPPQPPIHSPLSNHSNNISPLNPSDLPPPPPIPASYSALGAGSPSSNMLYESSAAGSRADSNRRRRRAERARLEQARRDGLGGGGGGLGGAGGGAGLASGGGRMGPSVEFT